ncbi:hypothetical protein DMENIID0001_128330 [Sergentomyia squamirostris]
MMAGDFFKTEIYVSHDTLPEHREFMFLPAVKEEGDILDESQEYVDEKPHKEQVEVLAFSDEESNDDSFPVDSKTDIMLEGWSDEEMPGHSKAKPRQTRKRKKATPGRPKTIKGKKRAKKNDPLDEEDSPDQQSEEHDEQGDDEPGSSCDADGADGDADGSMLLALASTSQGDGPFICQICKKSYSSKGNFHSHVLSHQGISNFFCEICGKSIDTRGAWKHMQSHEDVNLNCPVCNKAFATVARRDRHIKTHSGEKSHKCFFCEKTFARKDHAKQHMIRCPRAKDFGAAACQKEFQVQEKIKPKRVTVKARPKIYQYAEEDMAKAIVAAKTGMSLRRAAKLFKVPHTTLHEKLAENCPIRKRLGQPAALSKEIELALTQWIFSCEEQGHIITRQELFDAVQTLCRQMKIETKFTNGRPGRIWYLQFLKRNPIMAKTMLTKREKDKAVVQGKGEAAENLDEFLNVFDIDPITPKPQVRYTQEDLIRAVAEVKAGASARSVAKKYNIPKTSLNNKTTGRYPIISIIGAPHTLKKDEELAVIQWVLKCEERGHKLTKTEFLDAIQTLCKLLKIKTKFTNGRPGPVWFSCFVKNYPIMKRMTKKTKKELLVANESENQISNDLDEFQKKFGKDPLVTTSKNIKPPIKKQNLHVKTRKKLQKQRKSGKLSNSPKTKTKAQQLGYSVENLRKAYEAVKAGMSLRKAAAKYQVPKSTIFHKTSGKYPDFMSSMANIKTLKTDQERAITQWILCCDELGHKVTQTELCDAVKVLCEELNIKTKFKDGRPGKSWLTNFYKRNPILVKLMTRVIGKELTPLDILQMRKLVPAPETESDLTLFHAASLLNDTKPTKKVKAISHKKVLTKKSATLLTSEPKIRRKRCLYSDEDLRNAFEAIKAGMSVRKASAKYNVPSTTICDKVSGKSPYLTKYVHGSTLSSEQELAVTQWVFQCDSLGHRITRSELCDAIKALCEELNIKTKFKDGRPGRVWIQNFYKRNPMLVKLIKREVGKELTPLDILRMRNLVPVPEKATSMLDNKKSKFKAESSQKRVPKKKPATLLSSDPKPRRKYWSYSEEDLMKALKAVQAGMSLPKASAMYQVPKSTIFNKVSGKHPNLARYTNLKALSPEQELAVTQWVLQCESLGHRVTRPELCNAVKVLCDVLNLKTRFKKNEGPGKHWCHNFLNRNPILIKRMTRECGKELSPLDILQMRKLVPMPPIPESQSDLNLFLEKYGNFEESVTFQTLKYHYWPGGNVK